MDLEPNTYRLGGKRTVAIGVPGDQPGDFITLQWVAVGCREMGQWLARGILDFDPYVATGSGQVVDFEFSATHLQWRGRELPSLRATAQRHEAVDPIGETPQPCVGPTEVILGGVDRVLTVIAGSGDESPGHVIAAITLAVLRRVFRDNRPGPPLEPMSVATGHQDRLDTTVLVR